MSEDAAHSGYLLQPVVRRFLCFGDDERRRMIHADESVNRQIFIYLQPVNSVTGGGYLEAFPLFLRRVAQPLRLTGNIDLVILPVDS